MTRQLKNLKLVLTKKGSSPNALFHVMSSDLLILVATTECQEHTTQLLLTLGFGDQSSLRSLAISHKPEGNATVSDTTRTISFAMARLNRGASLETRVSPLWQRSVSQGPQSHRRKARNQDSMRHSFTYFGKLKHPKRTHPQKRAKIRDSSQFLTCSRF